MITLLRIVAALRNGVRTISPTCRDMTRLQSLAMERQLTGAQQFGMRLHLLLCRWCRRYRQHLQLIKNLLRTKPEKLADARPAQLPDTARERIKLALRGAQSRSD